jgi:hypothetical protein
LISTYDDNDQTVGHLVDLRGALNDLAVALRDGQFNARCH